MTREQLVGEWQVTPEYHVILRADGSAQFVVSDLEAPVEGTWRFLDAGRFELLRPIPSYPDGPNTIPGGHQVTHYEIRAADGRRMSLQGYEGGEGGLEYDPESWSRSVW